MQAGALIVALGGVGYFLPIGLVGLVVDRLLLGVGEAALFTAGAVWTLCVGAPLLALALISSVPSSQHQPTGTKRGSILPRTTIAPGIALALAAGGYASLAAFVVLHLQARHIHDGVVVLSCFSAVYAGTRLVIGRFPDRYGPRRVATVCAIGEAAGLLIIAVAPNLAVAIAGSLVMGVGFSLLHPSLALMVMNRTDKSQQGAALGAYTSFWDLGVALWGPVGGLVAGGLGYPAVFVVGAGCALVSAVMALLIAEPTARPVAVAG
jgi:MFS family permease